MGMKRFAQGATRLHSAPLSLASTGLPSSSAFATTRRVKRRTSQSRPRVDSFDVFASSDIAIVFGLHADDVAALPARIPGRKRSPLQTACKQMGAREGPGAPQRRDA